MHKAWLRDTWRGKFDKPPELIARDMGLDPTKLSQEQLQAMKTADDLADEPLWTRTRFLSSVQAEHEISNALRGR